MDAPTVAATTPAAHDHGGVSVPMIVGAAVLCGLGILGMIYWLVTFRWLLFASLVPLVLGAYLLFTRVTGPDHA